jgi:diaminohydroxyphosphoribosylaminopyrimidine deaminase / 5-amino-6-(5-phosphoribosylamino)uracil reductase
MKQTEPKFTKQDEKWMRSALRAADRGRGYVSPNPLVGCVIVSASGEKLARGYHERYGKAHAEINALKQVRNETDLIDATVYVTLEPCSHHGKTPPCALTLSELPIKRVVVAMQDPNPKVNGDGIRMLRRNGIQVDVGLLADEARRQNEFFLHHVTERRPFVMLKIAQTIDGYTTSQSGESQWITGEQARKRVHYWRSIYDAVMIGRQTAVFDNPRLTVRHIEGRQPYRIVIDGPGELPEHLNLFNDQYVDKTYRVSWRKSTLPDGNSAEDVLRLMKPGNFLGHEISVSNHEGHADLDLTLARLGEMGIASVMVESGGTLGTALLRQGLVDKVHIFIAPKMLGGGKRSVLGLGIERMHEILTYKSIEWEQVGDDMLFTGYL